MSIEAMKQALEALTSTYQTKDEADINRSRVILVLEKAIEQAERQQALDKKAENARELGLDYEPSRAQTTQIAEGLKHCHHPDSQHEFLRVWIRDWTAHKFTPQAEKQEPVAWNENVDEMPFNTYCKAIVDWYSYATDGDSFLEGRDVEVIVVRYKLDEDEDDIVFIHKGNKQYAHTKCVVSKWMPLYTSSPKREWNELAVEELANEASQGEHAGEFALGAMWAAAVLKEKNHE